ncbi:CHAT domain-containing protein [Mycena galopus ATCC 62051]|nr:CHAT domain-containing protein [Mycena galopus ATCC 62051]
MDRESHAILGFPEDETNSQAPALDRDHHSLLSSPEIGANSQAQALDTEDLDQTIELRRQAVALYPAPHPDHGNALHALAIAVQTRFEQEGDFKDLEEAIELHQEALILRPAPHPDRSISLNNLANAVYIRFEHGGEFKDLEKAIEYDREALALQPAPHPHRSMSLYNLANAVQTRFEQKGEFEDLEEVIELYRETLKLHPAPHPDHSMSLNNLALAVQNRFEQKGDFKDLEEAIELYRKALILCLAPHPDHNISLNNLASAVQTRFEYKGYFEDLEEAIELNREALKLCPAPHPDRSMSLNNLGSAVQTRFLQKGELQDLEEAVECHREALLLRPAPHPKHCMSLHNLANAVRIRFGETGDPKDLEEAIELHRETLIFCPAYHPHRSIFLNNLANAVQTRFEHKGDFEDLEEAIELLREALLLHPAPHPFRSMSLHNLAKAVQIRFLEKREFKDLQEAIELYREALILCPAPHPDYSMSLNNLARAIQAQFEQKGDFKDLEEAIELYREALTLRPAPHPFRSMSLNNLASAVQTLFEQKRDFKNLEEAIELFREALTLRPAPHPERNISLNGLGHLLVHRYAKNHCDDDLNASISALEEASKYNYSSTLQRFHYSYDWAQIADQHGHSSALGAYHATINLLPQIAALHLHVVSRQSILTKLQGSQLVSDAATCAINQADYHSAVELLEAGRSIFWSQALHLQTPLHLLEAADPKLSFRLKQLAKDLELASFRDISRTRGIKNQEESIAMEAEGRRCQQLNEEWDATIQSVRLLPGLEDFMQPKHIRTLQQAAVSGPIIILIERNFVCFALIVKSTEQVKCVHLSMIDSHITNFQADLSQALSRSDFSNTAHTYSSTSVDSELEARLVGGPEGHAQKGPDEILRTLLADLWKTLVKPIFNELHLEKSTNPPRLWWCPTGSLIFLPIHAAGTYGKDDIDCVSDYVISSYTPTLAALLDPPTDKASFFKMTAVIQSTAPKFSKDFSPLPGSKEEFLAIKKWVPSAWLTSLGDTADATVPTALAHLRKSSVVHFACHGIQDLARPLESGLILSDGEVKVSELMRRPDGEAAETIKNSLALAFLSACETAKGDAGVPDEAMHLAATLLFAGFRSVVATLWTMQDADGPKIANRFYEHLFKDCDSESIPPVLPDLTKSAEALHYAVLELRKESDIPFKQWVPFVHYGL